jgi:hypothetical protein
VERAGQYGICVDVLMTRLILRLEWIRMFHFSIHC